MRTIRPENYKALFDKYKKRVIDYTDPEFLLTKDMDKFAKDIFFTEKARDVSDVICGCEAPPADLFVIGGTCPVCGEKVRRIGPTGNRHECWIVIADVLPPMLSPSVYKVLAQWFGDVRIEQPGRRSTLKRQLIDILMSVGEEEFLPEQFAGITTGMLGFYNNFDKIVDILQADYKSHRKYDQKNQQMAWYIHEYRDRLFTRYIPILDRRLHLVQEIGKKKRVDTAADKIVNVIMAIGAAYKAASTRRGKQADQYMKNALLSLLEYYDEQLKNKQFPKRGHIRRYLVGSRLHFTLRALVTPSPRMPSPDCIELPWTGAVCLYRLELINLLANRHNFSLFDAYAKTFIAEHQFDQLISDCFKALINECGYKGLPLLADRNPSLQHGSIQMVFCPFIKDDVEDKGVGVNPIAFFAANLDFDGDQINIAKIPEHDIIDSLYAIHPSSVLLTSQEVGLSGTLNCGVQPAICWNSYIEDGMNLFTETLPDGSVRDKQLA